MSTTTDRECAECGTAFPASSRRPARTCSPRCSGLYGSRTRRSRVQQEPEREQPARETAIADRVLVGNVMLWLAGGDEALAVYLMGGDHGQVTLEALRRAWKSMPLADRAEYR